MQASPIRKFSLIRLLRALKEDARQLLHHEMELVKTELSERLLSMGRDVATLAFAGVIAYAGLIVFLVGLGWLVAWALQRAGVQPVLAAFIGLAGVGLLIAAAGGAFLFRGLRTFSQASQAPRKTIHGIQPGEGAEQQPGSASEASKPEGKSRAEIHERIEKTEDQLSHALDELGHRFSPREINARVKHRIQEKPYQSGLLAMAAGVLGGLFLTRSSRRAS